MSTHGAVALSIKCSSMANLSVTGASCRHSSSTSCGTMSSWLSSYSRLAVLLGVLDVLALGYTMPLIYSASCRPVKVCISYLMQSWGDCDCVVCWCCCFMWLAHVDATPAGTQTHTAARTTRH